VLQPHMLAPTDLIRSLAKEALLSASSSGKLEQAIAATAPATMELRQRALKVLLQAGKPVDSQMIPNKIAPRMSEHSGSNPVELPRLLQSRRSWGVFAEVQPFGMSEEQAIAAAISESSIESSAACDAVSSPSSTEAHVGTLQSNEVPLPLLWQVPRVVSFKRVAVAFNSASSAVAVASAAVEDKLNAIGDAWDSIDNTAEMYTQRVETTVSDKAMEISNKSRSTYDGVVTTVSDKANAIDAAAQKNWKQVEVIAKDKRTMVTEIVINNTTMVTNKAKAISEAAAVNTTMVTNRAKAISEAAAVVRTKTQVLARGAVQGNNVREGLQAARGKVLAAFTPPQRSRGGA